MRHIPAVLVAITFGLLAPGTVRGQAYNYSWSADGGATFLPASGATVTVGVPGSSVTLRLFLEEQTGTNTLDTNGLFAVGAKVSFTNPTNGSAVPSVTDADVKGNVTGASNIFNDSGAYGRTSGAGLVELSEATNAALVGVKPTSGTPKRVFVGDFRFVVQGTGTETTVVTADDIGSPDTTILAITGVTLDSAITARSVSLTPVPEPAGLLGLAAVGLLAARRRRAAPAG